MKLHDKKPTVIQEAQTLYLSSARCVAWIGALLTVALVFISVPAGYAQGYTFAEALNATDLVWTADSTDDTKWFVETTVSHDGVAAVECVPRVGVYGAKLHTKVTGPGTLTFWFRFGSGPPLATKLEIVLQKQGDVARRGLFGGSTQWSQGGTEIGEGVYDLQFGCVVTSTPEAVYLDQVQFTPSVRVYLEGLAIVEGQAQVQFFRSRKSGLLVHVAERHRPERTLDHEQRCCAEHQRNRRFVHSHRATRWQFSAILPGAVFSGAMKDRISHLQPRAAVA
jgi:hypothetical protein